MIFITEMAGALWIFQLANKCNRYLAINVKHFSHWTAHKTHWLAQNPWSSFFLPKEKLLLCYEVKISEDNVEIFTWSRESFTENESWPTNPTLSFFSFWGSFSKFFMQLASCSLPSIIQCLELRVSQHQSIQWLS